MADFDSSLPIRTETDGDAVVKVVDTAGTNILVIDASGNISSLITDGTDTLAISAAGAASVDIAANSIGLATEVTLSTLNGKVTACDTGSVTISSALPTGANNIGKVYITDGTTDVDVGTSGELIVDQLTGAVWDVSLAVSGTAVTDYDTASAVASSGTSNHTYTVTAGKTLTLKQVSFSSSGRAKIEVQTGTPLSETTKFVGFSSTANPNITWAPLNGITVAATDNVKIIRTNRAISAQDLYSTIQGTEA